MSRHSILVFVLVAAIAPSAALAAGDLAKGQKTFKDNCVTCHGEGGKGDGEQGKILQPPPRDFTKGDFKFDANKNGKAGEDADLHLVIAKGAFEFGGSPLMAPLGLSDTDIDNVIAVIRSFKKK